jgi:hypothetical protein
MRGVGWWGLLISGAAVAEEVPATEAAPAEEVSPTPAEGPPPAEPAPTAAASAAATPPVSPRGGTTIALSAAGGFDFTTRQPWLGLDVAFQPDQLRGFAFAGRVQAGWGFGDQRPLGVVQLGFAGVVPAESALVRVGLLAHAELYVVDYPLPVQVGEPVEGTFGNFGMFPGGLLLAELGWHRAGTRGPAAWSIGLRLGAAPVAVVEECPFNGTSQDELCYGSRVGILGGITGRLRFHEGVYLEAVGGPSPMLSLGYAFPTGQR